MSNGIDPSTFERTSIDFPDGDDGRVYHDGPTIAESENIYPSVTTVTGRKKDPGKKKAIRYWKKNNNGKNGNPYHGHIWDYSGPRGTIVHWYCLTHLTDEQVGGEEETEALDWVSEHSRDYNYVYSILKNHNKFATLPDPHDYNMAFDMDDEDDPKTLREILWEDAHWALDAFANQMKPMGLAKNNFDESHYNTFSTYFDRGVRTSNVIDVEKYVVNTDVHYSGQFDLLYKDPSGNRVLCDLKTSSKINTPQYKMQAEAYARALDVYPDELMIMQLQPDKKETKISRSGEWSESRDDLWEDFCELCKEVQMLAQDAAEEEAAA